MIISKLHSVLNKFNSKRSKPISIRELSRILGINRTTLLNLVNNQANNISFKNLNKLIEFFNVNVDDLIKYSSESYLINIDYTDDLLASKVITPLVAIPNIKKHLQNSFTLTCNQIPNTYFTIIPFLINRIHETYKFKMLCRCSGTSPLSSEAVKFQNLVTNFPKSLMYSILLNIFTSVEFNKMLPSELTLKQVDIYFSNYAPKNNLLNSMIDFSNYHIRIPKSNVKSNPLNNYGNPTLKNITTHHSITLNNGKKCKIYSHI